MRLDYDELFADIISLRAAAFPAEHASFCAANTHPHNNPRVNANASMYDPIHKVPVVSDGDAQHLAPVEHNNTWARRRSGP